MISISDCRGCSQPQWYYRQARSRPAPRPAPRPPLSPASVPGDGKRPAPAESKPHREQKPPARRGLAAMLPEGIDTGDILLAAMLLFLYSESRDEEFLIILAVVALSVFRK